MCQYIPSPIHIIILLACVYKYNCFNVVQLGSISAVCADHLVTWSMSSRGSFVGTVAAEISLRLFLLQEVQVWFQCWFLKEPVGGAWLFVVWF